MDEIVLHIHDNQCQLADLWSPHRALHVRLP
jgi:hypothetical protein